MINYKAFYTLIDGMVKEAAAAERPTILGDAAKAVSNLDLSDADPNEWMLLPKTKGFMERTVPTYGVPRALIRQMQHNTKAGLNKTIYNGRGLSDMWKSVKGTAEKAMNGLDLSEADPTKAMPLPKTRGFMEYINPYYGAPRSILRWLQHNTKAGLNRYVYGKPAGLPPPPEYDAYKKWKEDRDISKLKMPDNNY